MKILRIKLIDHPQTCTTSIQIDVQDLMRDEFKEVKRVCLFCCLSVTYLVEKERLSCTIEHREIVQFLQLLATNFDVTI